jgi:hypothetical protein
LVSTSASTSTTISHPDHDLEAILLQFVDADGICRACDQNHSFQQDFEGVKASIDDIPKLFQAIKTLESF